MTRKKAIAAVDAREASFKEWFVAQYGERPLDDRQKEFDLKEIDDAREKIKALEIEQSADTEWLDRRDAALKAWQASRTQEK